MRSLKTLLWAFIVMWAMVAAIGFAALSNVSLIGMVIVLIVCAVHVWMYAYFLSQVNHEDQW